MIYFLIYLLVEVLVTVEIASQIGGLNTFFEIVGSAFFGIFILMNFRHTLAENVYALRSSQIDMDGFTKRNLFGLFGAVLLILPGIFGDILGLLMQFSLLSKFFVNRFSGKYRSQNCQEFYTSPRKDDYVIDAEIIDDTPALR
ncbi:FxsA family protein [Sulfuricurvum sp.]|uniref:FxsA family protein n=1 Tax=Sulfuricurvum sp. TaxID=2025608 RepID=UPI001992DBFC|nr:FxsA family protein [Sulfuricurvum sp.]MBD3798402.1 FxsA family protein [Campylobacterota bacterium]MBD3805608.1 FxsA family protein [Sulfuricurvum sp.]